MLGGIYKKGDAFTRDVSHRIISLYKKALKYIMVFGNGVGLKWGPAQMRTNLQTQSHINLGVGLQVPAWLGVSQPIPEPDPLPFLCAYL